MQTGGGDLNPERLEGVGDRAHQRGGSGDDGRLPDAAEAARQLRRGLARDLERPLAGVRRG